MISYYVKRLNYYVKKLGYLVYEVCELVYTTSYYLNARLDLSIQCIIMAKVYVIMLKSGVVLLNQYVVLFNCVVLFPKINACDIVWTKRHVSLT